jgi:nitrogen fixation protein FixH
VSPIVRKERIWPTIVVVVLGGYLVFGIVAARVASHDPNFAIEPDYYRKAVAWDSTLAQDRRSVALGWHLTPTLGPIGDGTAALLAFEFRDSGGALVTEAHVSVEARQVAHADVVVRATLAVRDDGAYAAHLPLARAGLWEFRVVATHGADRFATSVRMDASTTAIARVVEERPGDPSTARAKAGARREDAVTDVRPRAQ